MPKKKSQLELNIPLHESEHGIDINGRYTVVGKVEWMGKMYTVRDWHKRKFLLSFSVPSKFQKPGLENEYMFFEVTDKMYHWINRLDDIYTEDIIKVCFRVDSRLYKVDGEQQYDNFNNMKVFMSLVPIDIELLERRGVEPVYMDINAPEPKEKQDEVEEISDLPFVLLPPILILGSLLIF